LKPVLLVVALICCWGHVFGYSVFHLGNSHTWDLKPNYGLRKIFEAGSEVLNNDWQIVCGRSLSYIVTNPTSACVYAENYEDFVTALTTKAWDVVTIQPFPGSSGRDEIDALSAIIDLAGWRSAPGQTRFLVYCTWPIVPVDIELSDYNYAQAWQLPYAATSDPTLADREFFIYAMKSIRDQHPDLPIEAIPVGAVLQAFHLEAEAGLIPGFTGAGDLYRDRYHMNNVGHYIAAATTYSVITGNAASDLGSDSLVGFAAGTESLVDHVITTSLRTKILSLVDHIIAQKPFDDLPLDLTVSNKTASFKTYTGYNYTLQYSENLQFWQTILEFTPGDSSWLEHSANEANSKGFWKLSRF